MASVEYEDGDTEVMDVTEVDRLASFGLSCVYTEAHKRRGTNRMNHPGVSLDFKGPDKQLRRRGSRQRPGEERAWR